MSIVKLRAGETILVAAVDPDLEIGGGPIIPPDLGLGIPTHPIVLPPDPTDPLPPSGAHPSHPISRPDLKPTRLYCHRKENFRRRLTPAPRQTGN